jgi:hypothetical protein
VGFEPPHGYVAVLGGARFFPSASNDRVFIGVAGEYARFYLDPFEDGNNIAEGLEPDTYLSIWGTAELSDGPDHLRCSERHGRLLHRPAGRSQFLQLPERAGQV